MFKGGLGNLMKQAQQMQENVQKMQEEIANTEVIGEAGAGLVKVTINGNHQASRIVIDESAWEDREMLEDLIVAAINDASRKINRMSEEKLGSLKAGLSLPPGVKLPF